MTLHITVVPASTAAGRETIRTLLADDSRPEIRAVYRNITKVPAEFTSNANFRAVQGDVSDSSSLDFSGSDAVFYIPPPTYDGTDTAEFGTNAARNVKAALEKAQSVKRLLLFSAVGAENDRGIGIISINHVSEEILRTAAQEIVIIRPGYFMEFWAERLESLKNDPPYLESFISPADHKIIMVALQDVALICAQHLLADSRLKANPHVFTMHGPREYSANDVKDALEQITRKRIGVRRVESERLEEHFAAAIAQPYAGEMAEMVRASLPGGQIDEASKVEEGAVRGRTELVDSLRDIVNNDMIK